MKWLYNEFFYTAKHEKIRDNVLFAKIIVSLILIFVFLGAMSISAYAYFSCNISSANNTLKSASFSPTVSLSDSIGNAVEFSEQKPNNYTAALSTGTYTVNIQYGGTADTGFCVLNFSGYDNSYHTQQIIKTSVNSQELSSTLEFTLAVTGNITLTLFPHWGTSSYYDAYKTKGENNELYITNGETLNIAGITVFAETDNKDEAPNTSDQNANTQSSLTQIAPDTKTKYEKTKNNILESSEDKTTSAEEDGNDADTEKVSGTESTTEDTEQLKDNNIVQEEVEETNKEE